MFAYDPAGFFEKGPKLENNSVTDSIYYFSGFARIEYEVGRALIAVKAAGVPITEYGLCFVFFLFSFFVLFVLTFRGFALIE